MLWHSRSYVTFCYELVFVEFSFQLPCERQLSLHSEHADILALPIQKCKRIDYVTSQIALQNSFSMHTDVERMRVCTGKDSLVFRVFRILLTNTPRIYKRNLSLIFLIKLSIPDKIFWADSSRGKYKYHSTHVQTTATILPKWVDLIKCKFVGKFCVHIECFFAINSWSSKKTSIQTIRGYQIMCWCLLFTEYLATTKILYVVKISKLKIGNFRQAIWSLCGHVRNLKFFATG